MLNVENIMKRQFGGQMLLYQQEVRLYGREVIVSVCFYRYVFQKYFAVHETYGSMYILKTISYLIIRKYDKKQWL